MTVVHKLIAMSLLTSVMNDMIIQKKDGSQVSMRPHINVFIYQPFGTGKSYSVDDLIKKGYAVPCNRYSEAGFIGTIERSGMFRKGSLLRAGGKILLIDEFQNLKDHQKELLLEVIEQRRTSRSIGIHTPVPIEEKDEYIEYVIDGGYIYIKKIRFSVIALSMKSNYKRYNDLALLSRFIPIFITPSLEDLYISLTEEKPPDYSKYAKHLDLFKHRDYFVPYKVLNYTAKVMKSIIKSLNMSISFYMRLTLDLLRLAGIRAVMSNRDVTIEDVELVFGLLNFIIRNMQCEGLSLLDLKVLDAITQSCEEKGYATAQDIVSKVESYELKQIQESIKKLYNRKLIDVENNNNITVFKIRKIKI